MNKVKITVDFFSVVVGDGSRPFTQILQEVGARELCDREATFKGITYRLDAFTAHRGMFSGDVLRVRMNRIPTRVRPSVPSQPIDLQDDEGIGEHNAFIYHPGTNTLVLERHRGGVNHLVFGDYFHHVLPSDVPVTLLPVIQKDALRRLSKMKSIQRFELSLSNADARVFRANGLSDNRVAELISYFGAPNVSLTVSTGYDRKGSIRVKAVRELVRTIFRGGDDTIQQVSTLRVKGQEDNEVEILDLIADRMVEVVDVNMSDRRVPYVDRLGAIHKAFIARQAELRELSSEQE